MQQLMRDTEQQVSALKQGDRVALVFASNDPVHFAIAFCACLMAGLVAIPIDVPNVANPTTNNTPSAATSHTLGLGFLLGQVGASLVLTSDACYKSCAKCTNGDTIDVKGKSF